MDVSTVDEYYWKQTSFFGGWGSGLYCGKEPFYDVESMLTEQKMFLFCDSLKMAFMIKLYALMTFTKEKDVIKFIFGQLSLGVTFSFTQT